MRDVAGRVYEADAPVLDGRGGLPLPLGRLASYLYRLAILIRHDDFLSVSRALNALSPLLLTSREELFGWAKRRL